MLGWLKPQAVAYDGHVLPRRGLRTGGPHFKDDAAFLRSARAEARRLREELGLGDGARVLDVGCGYGRLAIGVLAEAMPLSRYCGLDVDAKAIAWCRRYLAPRSRVLEFAHVDVHNARYNPRGREATRARLPFEDASFDGIYLYSVFSHMLSADVQTYLHELARLLPPGGRIFFTAFVEDDVPDETENPPEYGTSWTGRLHCVRFSRRRMTQMIEHAGLQLDRQVPAKETDGQSALYLTRL